MATRDLNTSRGYSLTVNLEKDLANQKFYGKIIEGKSTTCYVLGYRT